MLLAISPSVWGSVPTWIIMAAVIFWGSHLYSRGGTGQAVGFLQQTNTTLVEQNNTLTETNKTLTVENAELKKSRDFEQAMKPIVTMLEHHDKSTTELFERHLVILDLIATKLGADTHSE